MNSMVIYLTVEVLLTSTLETQDLQLIFKHSYGDLNSL